MYHLGYKDQPYIIFRHNDIEREHYHVVSVRINKEGYKINNYYENKRMIDYARKIGPEYGFSINPSHDNSEKPERNPWMANDPVITARFVPGKPVIEQLNGIFRNAMRYSFRSFDDLSAVLLRQGIRASLNQPADAKPYITLQGTNLKGKPVSEPISEGVAGQEWYESYRVRKDHNCLRANYTEKYSVSHCLQESYHRCSTAQGYVKQETAFKGVTSRRERKQAEEQVVVYCHSPAVVPHWAAAWQFLEWAYPGDSGRKQGEI